MGKANKQLTGHTRKPVPGRDEDRCQPVLVRAEPEDMHANHRATNVAADSKYSAIRSFMFWNAGRAA
jgi:hypothetical protein